MEWFFLVLELSQAELLKAEVVKLHDCKKILESAQNLDIWAQNS